MIPIGLLVASPLRVIEIYLSSRLEVGLLEETIFVNISLKVLPLVDSIFNIISLSTDGVRQHFICFRDLLELLCRSSFMSLILVLLEVRMELLGLPIISKFDFFLRGSCLHLQDLVKRLVFFPNVKE